MTAVDEYINTVIKPGAEGSELLASLCAPTLRNSAYVDVLSSGMGGMAVLRVPDDYNLVVHSAAADPHKSDIAEHAASLMDRLYEQSSQMDAQPLALANVIDARTGEGEVVRRIGDALASKANEMHVAIVNGELAVLGDRINCDANVSGTMVSLVPKFLHKPDRYERNGVVYVVLDPEGKAVYVNSDGVGTKTEFAERRKVFHLPLRDSLAMKCDDASKRGAKVKVVFDVVERNNNGIPTGALDWNARHIIGSSMNFYYVLVHENVGKRLLGWREGAAAYNISGSAVSVINEELLKNPPIPTAGEYIIAIRGSPNPRSNGITDKRKAMVRVFGNKWHKTPEGKMFMEFLAEPSTIFYRIFDELMESGNATSVYHMSGGAYNGKLAKPLADHGLYVRLEGLFPPDWRELALAGFGFTPAEVAYAKWPMGNEGFITTRNPDEAGRIITKYGLDARTVGQLQAAKDGVTGVTIAGIKSSDGKEVYFSGH